MRHPTSPSPQLSANARELATEHLDLVTVIARSTRRRLPRYYDLDELESAGALGLVEAASRFNAQLGIPFRAYARTRIRGAILDYLREIDPLTRTQRQRVAAAGVSFHDDQLDWIDEEFRDLIEARSATPRPEPGYVVQLDAALVREAVDDLEPKLRRVIIRYYFDGGTLRSLERSMRMGVSNLSRLHHQALRQLRAQLVARGFADAPMN